MKTQRASVVKIETVDGNLNIQDLNALLADGWTVVSMEQSASGAILVICEKEQ